MKVVYLIFLLFFLNSIDNFGQVTAFTISGQQVMLSTDGSWEKYVASEDDADANLPLNMNNSPYAQEISQLLEIAEQNERHQFSENYRLDLNISKCETAITKLKAEGNNEKLDQLNTILSKLRLQQKNDEKLYSASAKIVNEVRNIPNLRVSKQQNAIQKLSKTLSVEIIETAIPESKSVETNTSKVEDQNIKRNAIDIADCKYAILDGMKGKSHIELAALPFYTYTSPQMKQYFKDKELMETKISLVQKEKKTYIRLHINIISRDAAKNYGLINKGNMFRIHLINGTNVNLYAEEDIRYELENYTGNAIYSGLFPITSDDIDTLKKVPIDKAGIVWSSGFELYDIYNVDTIIQLFNCLQSIK